MGTLDTKSVLKVSALCFGGGLAAGLIMSKMEKKLNSKIDEKNPPEKWVLVGHISELIIYPVKSIHGIRVDQAIATNLGLQDSENPSLRDRIFLITNDKGGALTQRLLPSMALIHPNVQDELLVLKFVGSEDHKESEINVPFPLDVGSNKKQVRIWNDKVYALDCGDEVAKWLDKVTGSTGLRLVYHDSDTSQRKVAADQRKFPFFSQNDTGTFQDETSYMLMTEESMAELNSKLERKLTPRSFRPSIMMTGSPEPWAEDLWSFIRIGSDSEKCPIFKTARPCVRCKMTTLNPDTGNPWSDDQEPVKTLISLKRQVGDATVTKIVKNSAVMGNHLGMFKNENSIISIGDPVYAAVL